MSIKGGPLCGGFIATLWVLAVIEAYAGGIDFSEDAEPESSIRHSGPDSQGIVSNLTMIPLDRMQCYSSISLGMFK